MSEYKTEPKSTFFINSTFALLFFLVGIWLLSGDVFRPYWQLRILSFLSAFSVSPVIWFGILLEGAYITYSPLRKKKRKNLQVVGLENTIKELEGIVREKDRTIDEMRTFMAKRIKEAYKDET